MLNKIKGALEDPKTWDEWVVLFAFMISLFSVALGLLLFVIVLIDSYPLVLLIIPTIVIAAFVSLLTRK